MAVVQTVHALVFTFKSLALRCFKLTSTVSLLRLELSCVYYEVTEFFLIVSSRVINEIFDEASIFQKIADYPE